MDPIDTAHRHILREKYEIFNSQLPEPSRIEFKFVFGIPNTTEQIRQLEKERTEFPNDIVVVNRPESRDTGKILDWFRYARGTGYWWHSLRGYCPRYRYIGKADIDAVIHIPRLLQMIEALPTSIPNFMGRRSYTHLTGMLYLLSTSLVEWIHFSKDVQQHVVGIEDTVVGDWVKNSGINVNWADMGRTFHDLPDSPNWCPGVITNKTVVVHWCKDESHFQQCIGGLLDGESQVNDIGHPFTEQEGLRQRSFELGVNLTEYQVKLATEEIRIQSRNKPEAPRRISMKQVDQIIRSATKLQALDPKKDVVERKIENKLVKKASNRNHHVFQKRIQ